MRLRTTVAWLACILPACGQAAPPNRYEIREGGFAIRNGPGYFNRPLFGTHQPSMLLSGDRPAFAWFAPNDIGKIGTLYLGIATPRGARWIHLLSEIESVYQPGLTRHTLRDPVLDGGELDVTAVPLASAEGFVLRLRAGVDARGIYTARGGIPFAQRATGHNAVMLSRWRGFPKSVEIPAGRAARKLYLMASAATFPMQSHIANARVTIVYADGG